MSHYPSQDKTWEQLGTAKIQVLIVLIGKFFPKKSLQIILQSENISQNQYREGCRDCCSKHFSAEKSDKSLTTNRTKLMSWNTIGLIL